MMAVIQFALTIVVSCFTVDFPYKTKFGTRPLAHPQCISMGHFLLGV